MEPTRDIRRQQIDPMRYPHQETICKFILQKHLTMFET